jgi:NAD(P)-dependent dehydrogenase (short-subunit alcohol dehydrogenase family)
MTTTATMPLEVDVTDQVENVLVIGATTPGGIGETVAKMFKHWYHVLTPSPDVMDVTSYGHVDQYIERNGPFSHVIYCAGIQHLGTLDELDPHEAEDVFDVNVLGYIRLMSSLVRHQDGGKVCAISSLAGRTPMTGSIAYCASKAALNHAIKCAARELKSDWQITAVVPGTVADTPLTSAVDKQIMQMRGWSGTQLLEQERIRQPFGRRISKGEVADVVYSLMMGPMTLTGSIVDLTGGA